MFSQGDQILNQLSQYDKQKQLRSQLSDTQLSKEGNNLNSISNFNSNSNSNSRTRLGTSVSSNSLKLRNSSNDILNRRPSGELFTSPTDRYYIAHQDLNTYKDELLNSQLDLMTLASPKTGNSIILNNTMHNKELSLEDGHGGGNIDGNKNKNENEDDNEIGGEHKIKHKHYTSLKIKDLRPRYVPPINFGIVEADLYRSGHPQPISYPFLESLKLKTIIYIGDKCDNWDYYKWIKGEEIDFNYIPLEFAFKGGDEKKIKKKEKENKDLRKINIEDNINKIMNILLCKENYPILIHSNKGKHRVGVLIGLIRKFLQGWTLSGAYDEYGKFTREKGEYDLEFIEVFQPILRYNIDTKPDFVRMNI